MQSRLTARIPMTPTAPPRAALASPEAWKPGAPALLSLLLALTALVYWPSLSGGYLFDDSYYIQNPAMQVTTLHPSDWARAAFSQVGAKQFRGLSMLSFAANYFFTGPDPWWFKVTNIAIHLLNGGLLFLLLRQLLRLHHEIRTTRGQPPLTLSIDGFALAIAGLWLLAPINLTGVAYISQRIEALATVFVLAGIYFYLRWRRRNYATGVAPHAGWGIVLTFTLIGLTAKESAALLPLFTACIEFALTGFRNQDGRWSKPAIFTHTVFLLVPMIVGTLWLSRWIFAAADHFRTFTIGQRLLTEPRVLVAYIDWTLLPTLRQLTFYHDDLAISHGLLSPPSTLAAIAFLVGLLALAVWQRNRRPLFCLGMLWFFAGHAMTATIIPLELVFEHRNYFPSIGLLLAVASVLGYQARPVKAPIPTLAAVIALAFFSTTTFARSCEWSNPLRLAYAEASKRPDSMRAQYALAQSLIASAGDDVRSPLLDRAKSILNRTVYRNDSGLAPAQALIFIAGRTHQPVDPRWWSEIVRKLKAGPPSQTDIQAIVFLPRCMRHDDCLFQPAQMLDVFLAALPASGDNPDIMSAYAEFAFDVLHDPALAIQLSDDIVTRFPNSPTYRANLVKALIAIGRFGEARHQIELLEKLNHWGSLDDTISTLESLLGQAIATSKPAPEASGTDPSPAMSPSP